jgi:vacuolar-type H+-ATPase catalytic subunit A/Vma1
MKKIEQVAAILLKNQIEFNYEPKYLKVNDKIISGDLFVTATYHTNTKKLVLMDGNYNEVSIETFINYFKK